MRAKHGHLGTEYKADPGPAAELNLLAGVDVPGDKAVQVSLLALLLLLP